MIVFKTYLKVLNKCKIPIIMYTIILIIFGGFNMQTQDSSMSFEATKPGVLIVNNDEQVGVTDNLIKYIEDNSNIVDLKNDEESISDGLFYRDVNYVIYIPANYRKDFLNGLNPEIKVQSTGDYQASLAEMILSRYMKVANVYEQIYQDEKVIIDKTNATLDKRIKVSVDSSLNNSQLSKATFYYNFLTYSLMAGAIYVICLILYSFQEEKIRKRTVISSMNIRKHNRYLLLSNILFAVVVWLFYVILSVILCGEVMFSLHGLIYIVNSLVFTFFCVTVAFLLSNLIHNKNAINGIVNVIALGPSFLCGAFVPMEFLPDVVVKVAHIIPSYWYIKTNEMVKSIEVFDFHSLQPVLINMGIILAFSLGFVIIANIIGKRNQKIG